MRKIKLGFVGAGFNGQIGHLDSFKKIKNCDFVALAEDRDKLRNLVKKKYKFKKAYKSHYELLKNEKKLDGVIIVTTPQKAAFDVARRGARMFEKVNVPILGVVENMSFLLNEENNEKSNEIF